jgi:uracil DNA glycosylase
MAQPTALQRLIFHLDEAAGAAFALRDNTEMPVDMKRLFKQLNDYAADLMEYEDNLPTNND